jgi:hypothetical protein
MQNVNLFPGLIKRDSRKTNGRTEVQIKVSLASSLDGLDAVAKREPLSVPRIEPQWSRSNDPAPPSVNHILLYINNKHGLSVKDSSNEDLLHTFSHVSAVFGKPSISIIFSDVCKK